MTTLWKREAEIWIKMSLLFLKHLRNSYASCRCLGQRLQSTSAAPVRPSKISVFLNDEIQKELKFLTKVDYTKIFSVAKGGQEIRPPTYEVIDK